LCAVYQRAVALLAQSQHPAIPARLISSAERVIGLLAAHARSSAPLSGPADFSAPLDWKGFSFRNEIRRYERFLIERALKDAHGIVTRASQLLGFKHYQSLITLLNKRHKSLTHARSPIFPRKRSIFPHAHQPRANKRRRPITILHVEDNRTFADALKEMLEAEGWRVESCADGGTALRRLAGHEHYDLLLFDNELPGPSGIELTRRARKLPHRRRIPIIMFSAGDCETEAWSAGVDAFLRKPEEALSVAETVSRLIEARPQNP
jgi:CheY-like chemotaxis protein